VEEAEHVRRFSRRLLRKVASWAFPRSVGRSVWRAAAAL
jgi:hypothetical protein